MSIVVRRPLYIKNAYSRAESFSHWERFLKTTASLSNLIPPCFYNPANYGRFSVCFLSPGVSYPPVYTVDSNKIPMRKPTSESSTKIERCPDWQNKIVLPHTLVNHSLWGSKNTKMLLPSTINTANFLTADYREMTIGVKHLLLFSQFVGWLVGWLVDWLVGWLVGWLWCSNSHPATIMSSPHEQRQHKKILRYYQPALAPKRHRRRQRRLSSLKLLVIW